MKQSGAPGESWGPRVACRGYCHCSNEDARMTQCGCVGMVVHEVVVSGDVSGLKSEMG